MFGSNKALSTHPDGTVVTTTTHTTKTVTPHHPSRASGMMDRLRPRKNTTTYAGTTSKPSRTGRMTKKSRPVPTAPATTATPRKTSVGDKVSGAMMKLKGGMTNRPGQKAAGTRRMNGTDGRVAPQYY